VRRHPNDWQTASQSSVLLAADPKSGFIEDLVAFLASLTSPQYKKLGDQEYARQLALSKVSRPQRDTARAFGPKPSQPPPPPF
jgi:hypothetical protein